MKEYNPLINNANKRQPEHKGNETTQSISGEEKALLDWKMEVMKPKWADFKDDESSLKNKLTNLESILDELSSYISEKNKNKIMLEEKISYFYKEFEKIKERKDSIDLDLDLKNLGKDVEKFFEENYKYKQSSENIE